MPNPYYTPLHFTAKLGMTVQKESAKLNQGVSTFCMKLLLEIFKDSYIKQWGKEDYEKAHKELSLTIDAQQKQKGKRKQKRKAKAIMILGYSKQEAEHLAKLPDEELKLVIDLAKAKAYNKQVDSHQNSQLEELDEEISLVEDDLKNLFTMKLRIFEHKYGKKFRKDVKNDLEIKLVTLKKRREEMELTK